ncbi:MAG: efflux RND transporter periplasmic adaptor subunit [Gemmataceae bacterium]
MIRVTLPVKGQVVASEDRVAHVIPRFGGIIKEVRKRLGERVEKGETLAVIESNQSLQRYEVQALLSGTVVKRHASLGEYASDSTEIFEVADLSEVFADFAVFSPDFGDVKEGRQVLVHVPGGGRPILSTISFVSPIVDAATQSKLARAALGNDDRSLLPGTYVRGEVVTAEFEAPLVIDASAPQSVGGETVVFVQEGGRLEPKVVALGRTDGLVTEVLSGVGPGTRYAKGNTFVLKAELGKGEAEHEH